MHACIHRYSERARESERRPLETPCQVAVQRAPSESLIRISYPVSYPVSYPSLYPSLLSKSLPASPGRHEKSPCRRRGPSHLSEPPIRVAHPSRDGTASTPGGLRGAARRLYPVHGVFAGRRSESPVRVVCYCRLSESSVRTRVQTALARADSGGAVWRAGARDGSPVRVINIIYIIY